jgi:hypothetical protein
MTMRMIYACLMVLFFTAPLVGALAPVFAQEQPPGTADIVAKMQSKLNLTQDQVIAITPIIEKYSSKREEILQSMKNGSKDKDSIRSQMKQLKEDEGQELSQVLSSDQMSQWEKMMSQGRHKHHGDDNGEGGGNGGSGGQ